MGTPGVLNKSLLNQSLYFLYLSLQESPYECLVFNPVPGGSQRGQYSMSSLGKDLQRPHTWGELGVCRCLQTAHAQPVLIPGHSALPPWALTALAGFASRGPPFAE